MFAHATFLSDNRDDLARITLPTLVIECAQDAIAPRGVGAYVADSCREFAGDPGRDRALPACERRRGHRGCDRRVRQSLQTMTDVDLGDLWDNAPCGHLIAEPGGRIIRANATLLAWLGYDRAGWTARWSATY